MSPTVTAAGQGDPGPIEKKTWPLFQGKEIAMYRSKRVTSGAAYTC